MYHIFIAVKNRIQNLIMASEPLIEDSLVGTNTIKLGDSKNFIWENFNKRYAQVILQDNDSTGRRVSGGYEGMTEYTIIDIDNESNELRISGEFEKNWTVANNSKIRRSPGGILVKDVRIGDLEVINQFPTICLVPNSKRLEWKTLSATQDTISLDFLVYIEGADTDRATEDMLKVTDVLEYILMTDLHIKPLGAEQEYQVTSHAKINSIDYGTIQKGSQFVKASRITWDADLYHWRGYLTSQGLLEAPLNGPF